MMLRRAMAFVLMMVMMFMCGSAPLLRVSAADAETVKGLVIRNNVAHKEIEELMTLRAKLALDYDANSEIIEQIDTRLMELGVEELSNAELMEKLGIVAQPLVVPEAQQYVKHMSERVVTAWNGEWYEVQIVTSAPTHPDSALRPDYNVTVESYEQQIADQFVFCGVVANGAISGVDGGTLGAVASTISLGFTLYDIYNSVVDAMTRTSVVSGSDANGKICLSIQEKFYFIKSYGALDAGNQFLVCGSNYVEYTVDLVADGDAMVDGVSVASTKNIVYNGNFTGQYFDDEEAAINRAAQIYWNCRHYGDYDFPIYFRVSPLRFCFVEDETTTVSVPYNGLSWTY